MTSVFFFFFFKEVLNSLIGFFCVCVCMQFIFHFCLYAFHFIYSSVRLARPYSTKYYLHYLHVLLTLPVHNAAVEDGAGGLGSGCLWQSLHPSMECELLPEASLGESGSVHLFLPSGCCRCRCQCGSVLSSSGRPPQNPGTAAARTRRRKMGCR